MEIRIAKTGQEIEKCKQYLIENELKPIANLYLYTERDGQITACTGIIFSGFIEPFCAEKSIDGFALLNFAQGLIGNRTSVITSMTTNDKVKNILEKTGFQKWSSKTEIYIKEL